MSFYQLFAIDIIFITLTVNCKENCDIGWFGPKCQYKCHCFETCSRDGECKNQKCENGWFGYKCQYQNNISEIKVKSGQTNVNTTVWTDNDDSTCIRNVSIFQIIIKLNDYTPLSYISLVVKDSALLNKFAVSFKNYLNSKNEQTCDGHMFTLVKNNTVILRCENRHFVFGVILTGKGVNSLCSIYVSRGRNVALKQSTEQSFPSGILYTENAVDGNRDTTFPLTSCFLNNTLSGVSPSWILTFDEPVVVGRYDLYYTGRAWYQFTMKSLDVNNITIYNTRLTLPFLSYSMSNLEFTPLKKIQITPVGSKTAIPIPFFCELEVYGECPSGKWGLDCIKQCGGKCPDFCNEWDGSCPTYCTGSLAAKCIKVNETTATQKLYTEQSTVGTSSLGFSVVVGSDAVVTNATTEGVKSNTEQSTVGTSSLGISVVVESDAVVTNATTERKSNTEHSTVDTSSLGISVGVIKATTEGLNASSLGINVKVGSEAVIIKATTESLAWKTGQSKVSAPSLWIGLGIGAGAVVLVIVIVVMIQIYRRKKYRRKHQYKLKTTNQTQF